VGGLASLMHESLSFFLFASSPGPHVTSLDTPHAQCVIIRCSGQGSAF